MKTITVKGNPYVPVSERVMHLATCYKNRYSLDTNYDYYPERKMWVVKAVLTITDEAGNLQSFTGLAQEVESDNYKQVNFTSALENAETSAIGRACAAAGIGISNGYASAEEIQKASNRMNGSTTKKEGLPVLDNARTMKEHTVERSIYLNQKENEEKGLATVAQKAEILLLLQHDSVTEEEKNKMIVSINKLTKDRAESAIINLKARARKYDHLNH